MTRDMEVTDVDRSSSDKTVGSQRLSGSLTSEEVLCIEQHLREQYRGVFDEKIILTHICDYVSSKFSDNLARVIASTSARGDTLLDVGSGYGAFVLACRRHGLEARGYELAAFEVEISRARLARVEPEADLQSVFVDGDAQQLPFPDETFSIVTLLNVLEHVSDYRAVLAEAGRVLRPGGRLFVICPNYAALRWEAHYHVPWLPFFPRKLAAVYLRLLGRNPGFFEKHIYYCTNWGVLRALRGIGMRTANLDVLRLDNIELFHSVRAQQFLRLMNRIRMMPILKLVLRISMHNPVKVAVTVVARKP